MERPRGGDSRLDSGGSGDSYLSAKLHFLMATRKLIYRIIHLYDVAASVSTNIQHPGVVSAHTAI